jgi:hypothetical protein
MFGRVSMAYVILYFHRIDRLAQGLEGACSEPWGANLPEEMMTPEESHIFNENMQEWKEREQAWSAARRVAKERGEDTPTEYGS